MKIKLQGETVELSEKAEISLMEFMVEIVKLMPYEQFDAGRAYIYEMEDTATGFLVEFDFGSNRFSPEDALEAFSVSYGGRF